MLKKFKIPFGPQDVAIMIGTGMVFFGLYLIYPPAAYIVIGAGIIYIGFPTGGE